MANPWLHITGIGEDGTSGLTPATQALMESAQVIVGGERLQGFVSNARAERLFWPSPFDTMIEEIRRLKGKRVVVLVSGDPLWHSAGELIGQAFDHEEICYHPQISAFQHAACRMGWSLAKSETLTIHGRAPQQIITRFYPDARLLILTQDASSPEYVARLLCDHGYENSRMCVLAAMGGPREKRFDGIAGQWSQTVPDLHTLAVECVAGKKARLLPETGLPDDVFYHDGKMTKQAVRALTLAKLAPQPGQLLWDIGAGCGSVAIEWIRAARDTRAIGIEPCVKRRALAAQNALALGVPDLKLIDGKVPEVLSDLAAPDAIFIGGGISNETIHLCHGILKLKGRLVVNAVTLESEAVLLNTFAKLGGELQRLTVQTALPLSSVSLHGWKNSMPVTQWSLVKS